MNNKITLNPTDSPLLRLANKRKSIPEKYKFEKDELKKVTCEISGCANKPHITQIIHHGR